MPLALSATTAGGREALAGRWLPKEEFPLRQADTIFHLAGMMGVWLPLADYRAVNVSGTEHVCRAALRAGVKRLIHISSWTVYGMALGRPAREDFPLNPFNEPYAVSKTEGDLVGSVCLVGDYPVADPADPSGFTNTIQYRQARRQTRGTYDLSSAEDWLAENEHDLDPLYVSPIEHTLQALRQWGQMYGDRQPVVVIAPDEFFKYGISGDGSYVIRLPNAGADAPLEGEWHRTAFVKYLRTCFAWGGFPGLECKVQRPESELAFLTCGLLPL